MRGARGGAVIEALRYKPEGRGIEADESPRMYKRRVYETMLYYAQCRTGPRTLRVEAKWPDVTWAQVWTNLCGAPVSDNIRMHWYKVIHELQPTNERLHKINISPTDACPNCHKTDTLMHRITECGEGAVIWGHARTKMAQIFRTTPGRIPADWLLHPSKQYGPRSGTERFYGYWHRWSISVHKQNGKWR
jgi:hypothetical protein